MTKRSRVLAVLVPLVMAAGPQVARAQGSIDLHSSMTATCVTTNCSLMQFALSVPNQGSFSNMLIKSFDLFSSSASLFQFASVNTIWNSFGTLYNQSSSTNLWSTSVSASGVFVAGSAGTNVANNPLYITLNMVAASPSLIGSGALTYDANGYVNGAAISRNLFSTNGTVTPEPASMLLLATGLSGVAGMVRRRRRRETTSV